MHDTRRVFMWGLISFAAVALFPGLLQGANNEFAPQSLTGWVEHSQLPDGSAMQDMGQIALAFTANRGQWDGRTLFRANASGATMWFTSEGTYYQFTRRIHRPESPGENSGATPVADSHWASSDDKSDGIENMTIKTSLIGGNQNPDVTGESLMDYTCNYFIGNDPLYWHADVPNYQAIHLKEVYSGIDLRYYGNGRQLEYDFIVFPGADPAQIAIRYEGALSLSVNVNGELVVETAWGEVVEQCPIVYQLRDGERKSIAGEYLFSGDNTIGFALGKNYDPTLPLVIDPVLTYSTYLGGSAYDGSYNIAVDGSGNSYVSGETDSPDFPTVGQYQTDQGGADVFVTKLNSAGNALVFSTYLGGNNTEYSEGIAIDDSGNIYVTGNTASTDFPTLNPYQAGYAGGSWDVFVTKLNSTGNALMYSTYLGGSGSEINNAVSIDGSGNAYLTGKTGSSNFPTQAPYQAAKGGNEDVFVARLNNAGNALTYSTYLGGSGDETGYGIFVDGTGNIYIAGLTKSTDFPTAGPYQANYGGGFSDVFVTKLNSAGDDLMYSTYIGGSDSDDARALAVDGSGNAYITGNTASTDFPTVGEYRSDQSERDIFVTKLHSTGNALVYSTYLGGSGQEFAEGIAVDDFGNAYVTGYTYSSDFPTEGEYQTHQGDRDVYVTRLNSAGNAVIYSTYLGGSNRDEGCDIAVDNSGNAYIAGVTESPDFPTVGAYQTHQGDWDAFVAKISTSPVGILEEAEGAVPKAFLLGQNYPNPFNTSTVIKYETYLPGPVVLEIFDILGRRIFEQQLETLAPGSHTFRWNGIDRSGRAVPSGIYFYRVATAGATQSRKMVLLK